MQSVTKEARVHNVGIDLRPVEKGMMYMFATFALKVGHLTGGRRRAVYKLFT